MTQQDIVLEERDCLPRVGAPEDRGCPADLICQHYQRLASRAFAGLDEEDTFRPKVPLPGLVPIQQ